MDHSDADYLRIACANLHFGGISRTGDLSPLFETLAVLSGWDVHIALLQEVSAGDEIGLKKHVRLIASELGMTLAALGARAPMTYGPNRPAVFVREPAGLKIVDYGPPEGVSGGVPAAWAHARVAILGVGNELDLLSVHLPPRSAVEQERQAEWMASSIAQWGNLALACGDFNSFAPGGPVLTEQQLREMDPHLRPARMIVEEGRFRPDYTVHDELTAIDMVDVAAALDPDARHPHDLTATGGSGGRIDRGYATRELKDALRGYWQAPGGSDHEHFMIALSKSAMSAARPRGYRP